METEKETDIDRKGHVKIDWGRQGGVILGYIVILLGYYGLIANLTMFDQYGNWLSYEDLPRYSIYETIGSELIFFPGRDMFFWTYITYIDTFFLPALLLFFICFLLTYKEDIPHYGIKASLWLVPLLIAEGFIFYALMFGITSEPIILKFARIEGYLDILILFGLAISGALSGMKVKQFIVARKTV
ncbi:MAG: hypothetical protein ACFE94_12855 [Candidatus Hodarchaeota archaeon]